MSRTAGSIHIHSSGPSKGNAAASQSDTSSQLSTVVIAVDFKWDAEFLKLQISLFINTPVFGAERTSSGEPDVDVRQCR